MYRKALIFLAILFFPAVVISQQLSQQVIVCAASVISPKALGNSSGYSQTIGEAVIAVVRDYDHVLTQGFQQPRIKMGKDPLPSGTGVKAYPNPVTDYVTVELFGEEARDLYIKIYNISGILLFTEEANFYGPYWEKRRIQVSHLSSGFYIIRVESSDKKINRAFKMEKL